MACIFNGDFVFYFTEKVAYEKIAADSWPKSLDDTSAKKDWDWEPIYDLESTIDVMFDLVKCQLIAEGKIIM